MPLHVILVLSLITGSILFCLSLGLSPFLISKKRESLPPVPLFPGSDFPNIYAIFYTIIFISLFGMASAHAYMIQFQGEEMTPSSAGDLIFNTLLQLLLYLPFLIIYFRLPSRALPKVSPLVKLFWVIVGLFLLTTPALLLDTAGINEWIIEQTGCPPLQDVVELMKNGPVDVKICMIVAAVIIAPVTEECCFRGFVYNILKQRNSRILAAFASAALFSAIHASLAQFLPLFIFGMVQCVAYEKARSLWLPILLHVLFNGLSSLMIIFVLQLS